MRRRRDRAREAQGAVPANCVPEADRLTTQRANPAKITTVTMSCLDTEKLAAVASDLQALHILVNTSSIMSENTILECAEVILPQLMLRPG